ncbi:hypothetical protein DFH08DRAFT_979494 [Mycena albidolilacea]|uniref:Uncharacterized protein n=1 Tax=Mycena albidolilacea TaxID=1033008 RepID=A0AAD6YWA9_9AGAR|nr:hypothetical protein DFH08DRAFT_979494 [Mycena albidolilacea]
MRPRCAAALVVRDTGCVHVWASASSHDFSAASDSTPGPIAHIEDWQKSDLFMRRGSKDSRWRCGVVGEVKTCAMAASPWRQGGWKHQRSVLYSLIMHFAPRGVPLPRVSTGHLLYTILHSAVLIFPYLPRCTAVDEYIPFSTPRCLDATRLRAPARYIANLSCSHYPNIPSTFIRPPQRPAHKGSTHLFPLLALFRMHHLQHLAGVPSSHPPPLPIPAPTVHFARPPFPASPVPSTPSCLIVLPPIFPYLHISPSSFPSSPSQLSLHLPCSQAGKLSSSLVPSQRSATCLVEEDLVPTLELNMHAGVVNAFLLGEKGLIFSGLFLVVDMLQLMTTIFVYSR